jgi:ABC-type nitrate/sulfonate/bicarbonate transport system permease component
MVSGAMATLSSGLEAGADRRQSALPRWMTSERVAPAVAGLAILLIWEVVVGTQLPDFVARPSGIIMAVPETVSSTEFWFDVVVTLGAILEGVAIGSAAGVLVGVAMGRVRELNWFLSTYIRALYALPLIALVPIVIIWVGYSPASRLVIVIISVFLPVAVTTADGTRAISKDYIDVGRMFGARTHNMWFGIALPSAMPFIVAGIELGFARGITNAIAVEVLASVPGMGMSVFTKSNELNENGSMVYVVCLAIFAVSVRAGMIRFRHWLAPWYRGSH